MVMELTNYNARRDIIKVYDEITVCTSLSIKD